jgi:phosphoribosyl-ATP pyrophosphohydrolase/phosphoribosyl-AMP cyclohydrolase
MMGDELAGRQATLSMAGLDELEFGPDGLVPAIVQDRRTKEVLMLGFMNREMLARTLETGDAWFWSRRRGRPWHKGETSGNFIRVREVRRNCEDNSLLLLADPIGPVCHTGARSCYFRTLDGEPVEAGEPAGSAGSAGPVGEAPVPAEPGARPPEGTLDWLFEIIEERRLRPREGSYTHRLLQGGVDRIGKKVGEEAAEVIIAAKNRSRTELANEMADLWYHALVLLAEAGMAPQDVYAVLAARHRDRTSPVDNMKK